MRADLQLRIGIQSANTVAEQIEVGCRKRSACAVASERIDLRISLAGHKAAAKHGLSERS
jgi:hypothetical protein